MNVGSIDSKLKGPGDTDLPPYNRGAGHLKDSNEAKIKYQEEILKELRKEYDSIQKKLDNLLDMRINESITMNEYDRKAYQLKQRQVELDRLLHEHTIADEQFSVTLNHLLNLVSRAYELLESSKVEQKRQIINFVLSKLLKDKKLIFTIRKPFDLFVNLKSRSKWLGD